MITLDIRRHSHRKNTGGSQLSQRGVDLARHCGESMGPYAVVATSVVPRSRETALAMGFAVDHEVVTLSADREFYAEVEAMHWWSETEPFTALASTFKTHGMYYRYANSLAAMWRDLLTPLSDGEAALVIGHSGELEAALVACFPEADHASWGGLFGPCEGARIVFDGEPAHFRAMELVRLPTAF